MVRRYKVVLLASLLIVVVFSLSVTAKTKTNLYTPEEIERARAIVRKEFWAKEQYNSIIATADEWFKFSDEELRRLIPFADVPRASDVHFRQCPIHSEEIKEYGSYPWIIDLKNPWKVQCPVGGEFYPSNDFDPEKPGAFEDVSSEDYIDNGWGWQKPGDPQKYWFVAYFNHWAIYTNLVPATTALGRAYLLTGDQKYSRKAAVILDRLAEVYPDMDYVDQSRYGTELTDRNYHGRIVNCIWETSLITTVAMAYDYIYEGLEGDTQLEKTLGKSIDEIKENIEQNLLEEAARSIYTMDNRIRGNYGMHQRALSVVAVVLDNENSDKYIDWVLFSPGKPNDYVYQGLASGLTNLLYRGGVGSESSPHYNNLWIGSFNTVATILLKRGVNLYEDYPRMKTIFDIPIKIAMNNEFTPNIGDSGTVISRGLEGWNPGWYEIAFRNYGDPIYAKVMAQLDAYGDKDLFIEPIKDQIQEAIKDHGKDIEYKSENLSGYGLALLRGGPSNDPLSVSLYYGKGGGHGHFDRLNIEVFGKRMRLVPDLGYPEFMSILHKKYCGWTRNTVSHATVVVDEKEQFNKDAGTLYHFASYPGLQYVDVSAENAYLNVTDTYRRSMALIDTPDGKNAYILDIFRVSGGSKHDYSIHGPAIGTFRVEGISLSSVQKKGTLAGEDVPFGTLYDNPKLEVAGYTGAYNGYTGSGFGYLFNVQRAKPKGTWSAVWDLKDGQKSKFRMIFIGQDDEIVVADGEPPKTGPEIPKTVKYILRRKEASNGDLESTFITIIEPYKEEPFIKSIEPLGTVDSAVALKVYYEAASDYIIQDNEGTDCYSFDDGIKSQAGLARLTVDTKGNVLGATIINGRYLEKDGFLLTMDKGYSGEVEKIDYDGGKIVVSLDDESSQLPTNGALNGRSLIFANKYHSTEYEIAEVSPLSDGRYEIEFKDKDFLCGYGRCEEAKPFLGFIKITADRDLFKREYYKGMYLVNSDRSMSGQITLAEDIGIGFLVKPHGSFELKKGEEFYIYDFGIGSTFTIETGISIKKEIQEKEEKKGFIVKTTSIKLVDTGKWNFETTSSIELKLPGEKNLEYMNLQGEWVEVPYTSDGVYRLDVSEFPGGKGVLRRAE